MIAALVNAALVTLVAFAAASHGVLLAGGAVPAWLLPAAAALGCLAALRHRPAAGEPAPRWLAGAAVFVLAAALVALVYGVVATPSRDWDGFVSWSMRARLLAPPATLDQPAFTDPAYYTHGRAYPLLQPLLVGAAGRLVFPALWLVLVGLVATAARRAGLGGSAAVVAALCAGLTPMWINPSAGAVDSGYADLLVAVAVTAGAAGLLNEAPLLALAGALLLPLIKPEGLPYAGLLCLATMIHGRNRTHAAATVGCVAAAVLWLPLRARLLAQPAGQVELAGPFVVGLGLALGRVAVVRWRGRGVAAVLGVLVVAAGAAGIAFGSREARSGDALSEILVAGLARLPQRLAELPAVGVGLAESLTFVRKLGLLFVIALTLFVLPRRVAGRCPSRGLALFFAGGLGVVVAALLLAPSDLAHELRSRHDRLLLHWVGAGWLLVAAWIGPIAWPRPSANGAAPDR